MFNTLFPDPPPPPLTSEPVVWIRRLAILRQLEPVEVIREIPFGLGLNLIVTKQPDANSVEALGHDVGKTLLTRLIRYLLGERHYADGQTRAAIRRALPDSVVAGEFRVRGENWAVLRPLGAPSTLNARAARVDSWRNLLDTAGADGEFNSFLQCLSDAVLEPVTSPLLTHARRPIEWTDVLAWIARDQRCRYRHPLVWRDADTDSGASALHIEDASTVLRCVSGLMDHGEKVLFEEHDSLLRKRQTLADEMKRLEQQISAEDDGLTSDLQALFNSEGVGISELELEMIRQQTRALSELRAEEVAKLDLANLRANYERALRAQADGAAQEKSLATQIGSVADHIQRHQERPRSVYEQFAAICDRQTDDCPAKLKIAKQQVPVPDLEGLAELQEELESHKARLAELRAKRPALTAELTSCQTDLTQAEERLSTLTSGIDGRIALYKAMDQRVHRHIQRTTRLPEARRELDNLTTEINQSRERQSQLRDSLAATRAWLPTRFSALCEELVGGSRRFELAIESKAIRLDVAGASGAPGEATSTSALVLSLDLAALQSATDGYGHHPRFMILDSPREADMEIGIFNRLMRRLAAWHKASSKPAFQLIVTTTTRPQDADVPPNAIRAELARIPSDDLLMGVEL